MTARAALRAFRHRRWLATLVVALLLALASLGEAHAYAHHGGAVACAICHWVKHTPAALVAAPAVSPEGIWLRLGPDAFDAGHHPELVEPGCRGPPSPA
jgi:hypothetical protein